MEPVDHESGNCYVASNAQESRGGDDLVAGEGALHCDHESDEAGWRTILISIGLRQHLPLTYRQNLEERQWVEQ